MGRPYRILNLLEQGLLFSAAIRPHRRSHPIVTEQRWSLLLYPAAVEKKNASGDNPVCAGHARVGCVHGVLLLVDLCVQHSVTATIYTRGDDVRQRNGPGPKTYAITTCVMHTAFQRGYIYRCSTLIR